MKCVQRERKQYFFMCLGSWVLLCLQHYVSPRLTEFKKASFDVCASIIPHSCSLCHITAAAAEKGLSGFPVQR